MKPEDIEMEFVNNFIRKERRERSLYILRNKKKRADFLGKFNHSRNEMIVEKDLIALYTKTDFDTWENIKSALKVKDSDLCYIISYDENNGQFIDRKKAFENCQSIGYAGLIINEDGKKVLSKNRIRCRGTGKIYRNKIKLICDVFIGSDAILGI